LALDADRAATWFIDRCLADATLVALLGGPDVYRDPIPPDVALPAIAVGVQGERPRIGAIRVGPNTHTATPTLVRASIWDTGTYAKVVQIADRLDLLFDGVSYQSFADKYVWSCVRQPAIPQREVVHDDITWLGWDLMWLITVKAT
jgi:hypothetical protein